MNGTRHSWLLALAVVTCVACGSSSPPPEDRPQQEAATPSAPSSTAPAPEAAAPAAPSDSAARPDGLGALLAEALRGSGGGAAFADVEADGDCPILYPPPEDEIAAQAQAIVPLKVGLTLSQVWRTIESEEDIECLSHVVAVDGESVRTSNTCLQTRDGEDPSYPRRTCRSDMRRSRVYQTMVGNVTPETIVGATSYSLSREAFAELTREGATRHRYIELKFRQGGTIATSYFQARLDGALTLEGRGTQTVIVNEAPTELPVLRVSGTVRGTWNDRSGEGRVFAAVLDDERFPLVLEYRLRDLGAHEFSVRYTKISYPGAIEKRLAEAGRIDVYGIYFDFASDRIRTESEPVLKEIADALGRHADWTVSIEGHTDSVGSDAANLDLSRRRSASVRTALVERYGIAADRLTTAGYGEGAPKDTNDTPEGRARNRRVELVRR